MTVYYPIVLETEASGAASARKRNQGARLARETRRAAGASR